MPETNENNNDERIEPCDLVEAEKSEAELARENFERNICQANNVWGYSELGLQAKGAAMSAIATKTGLYARIPLICKADNCPYADSCQLLGYNLAPQGEACPVETAQIEFRFLGYAQDFNLDKASFTDKNLVSELINLDIMIERCKALIAKQEVPVVDVVAGVGENGQEYYRPEVSKYWEGEEAKITVQFPRFGLKKLVEKYAQLEKA
jgi:hypothetical protein